MSIVDGLRYLPSGGAFDESICDRKTYEAFVKVARGADSDVEGCPAKLSVPTIFEYFIAYTEVLREDYHEHCLHRYDVGLGATESDIIDFADEEFDEYLCSGHVYLESDVHTLLESLGLVCIEMVDESEDGVYIAISNSPQISVTEIGGGDFYFAEERVKVNRGGR